MGKKGTAGKTASTQKIKKATEPRTTFEVGASAIVVIEQATVPKISKNSQELHLRPTQ